MAKFTLYGFDGSTYVRTVKMLLAEKNFTDFAQVPVNVLEGEPKEPEHLKRHPFGKVPTIEYDGFEILETSAIARYLNEKLPGKSLIPASAEDRARMDMTIGVLDSYGYGALVGGVAAYHLFPDFVGGKNDAMRSKGIETGRLTLDFLMKLRGDRPWIAGEAISLADLYLAPVLAYVAMTPDKATLMADARVADWWARIEQLPSLKATAPN